jgi:hypothetical protein
MYLLRHAFFEAAAGRRVNLGGGQGRRPLALPPIPPPNPHKGSGEGGAGGPNFPRQKKICHNHVILNEVKNLILFFYDLYSN